MNRRVTVVGLGLLGGSLLQALRDRHVEWRLQGVSSPEAVAKANDDGLIDRGWGYGDVDEWKRESDLLVLATPIDRIAELLQQIKQSPSQFAPGALITDVGSTKGALCQLGDSLFDGRHGEALFIGGHPMAGSEKRGLGARDGTLFESALWLLCPPPTLSDERAAPLLEMIELVGGRLHSLSPLEHDKIVAWVSHLPQILSSAIATTVARHNSNAAHFSGQGFRDITRLADSSYSVWESIFSTNKQELIGALQTTQQVIGEVIASLQENDQEAMEKLFDEARTLRTKVPPRSKGFSTTLVDLIVSVTDRPGALYAIVEPLTRARIDIRDLELLKVRGGMGGTFRASFRSVQEALHAAEVLRAEGMEARLPQ